MSSLPGALDLTEDGSADLAPQGTTRLKRVGGVLKVSADGGAFGDLGATVPAASASAPGTMSAADFSKLLAVLRPKPGTNLTNADQTLQPFTDKASQYTQATALTANRTKTLGTTSVVTGTRVRIVRTDTAAFTLIIVNGGGGAGTLFTFPASPTEIQSATFVKGATDWVLEGYDYQVVT